MGLNADTERELRKLIADAQERADFALSQINRVGGGTSFTFADKEVPAIGGGGTTLTLAHTPLAGTLHVWRGSAGTVGSAGSMSLDEDWSIVGAVVTLANAQVDANEVFRCSYRY